MYNVVLHKPSGESEVSIVDADGFFYANNSVSFFKRENMRGIGVATDNNVKTYFFKSGYALEFFKIEEEDE